MDYGYVSFIWLRTSLEGSRMVRFVIMIAWTSWIAKLVFTGFY